VNNTSFVTRRNVTVAPVSLRAFIYALCVLSSLIGLIFAPGSAWGIAVGDRVRVVNASVTVRDTAAGDSKGTQSTGATGTVTGGPTTASLGGVSYSWWNINFDSGVDGFVANPSSGGVVVLQAIATAPDLVIPSITVTPSSGSPGASFTVTLALKNQGSALAPVSTFRARIASCSSVSTSDPLLFESSPGPVAAGQTLTIPYAATIPTGIASGNYCVWGTADVFNSIGQSNTSNDQASTPFTITAASTQSLQVDSQLDGITLAGAPISLSPPPTSGGGTTTPVTAVYPASTSSVNVTLGTWVSNPLRRFTGWFASPVCTGGNNNVTCGVTMSSSRSITATYATQSSLSLIARVDGVGVAIPGFSRTATNTAGVASSSTTTPTATTSFTAPSSNTVIETYDLSQYVKLIAPSTYSSAAFSRWNGPTCLEGTNSGTSCTIRMSIGGNGFEAVYLSPANANLSFSIVNGSTANFAKLYTDASCTTYSGRTISGASGTFTGLAPGTYCVEAYRENADFAPAAISEFWGKGQTTLTSGANGSLSIARTEPYAQGFSFLDATTSQAISSTRTGQQVRLRASVHNLGAARTVNVRFEYRYTADPSTRYACTSSNVFAPAGGTIAVDCVFSPNSAGTIQRQLQVWGDVSQNFPTDSWQFSSTDTLTVSSSTSLTIAPVDLEVNYQSVTPFPATISALRGQRIRLRVKVSDGSGAGVVGAIVNAYRQGGFLSETPDMATTEVAGVPGLYDIFFYVPTKQSNAPLGGTKTLLVNASKSGFTSTQWSKDISIRPPPYGVTIAIHGFQPGGCSQDDEFVEKFASAVLQRKGKGLRHTYYQNDGRLERRDSIAQDGGASADGEWVFAVNWSCQSNNQTPGHAEAVAHALWATLKAYDPVTTSYENEANGVWAKARSSGRAIHIIAHSFGAAVAQQLLRRIVSANFEGLPNVHVTTLDPHEWQQNLTPVDGSTKLPNIDYTSFPSVRADNFFQRDTLLTVMPAGRCVAGAYNQLLSGSQVSSPPYLLDEHTKVWRRYLHTILPDSDPIVTTLPTLADDNWISEWESNTAKWFTGYAYSTAAGSAPPGANVCDEALSSLRYSTYSNEVATDVQVMGALGNQAARYPFDKYRVFDGGFAVDLEDTLSPVYLFTERAGYRNYTAVRKATSAGIDLAHNAADAARKVETNNTYVSSDVLSIRVKLKAAGVLVTELVSPDISVPKFVLPGTPYASSPNYETRYAPAFLGAVKVGLFVPTPTNPWANYQSLGIEDGANIFLKNTSGGTAQYCYSVPAPAQGGRLVNLSIDVDNAGGANGKYLVDDLELSTQACPSSSLSVTVYSQANGVPTSNVSMNVSGLVNQTLTTNSTSPAFVTVANTGALNFNAPATDSVGNAFDTWLGCDTLANRVCTVNLSNQSQHRGITVQYFSATVNGACGSANGSTLSVAPTTNLCQAGVKGPVTGSGPWAWTCAGRNGGATANCSAQILDTSPDALVFVSQNNVPVNTAVTSNIITITGINAAAPISISGGAFSVGCTSNFSAVSSTVLAGQSVCVRQSSSSLASTMTRATLCVGSVCANFDITTAAAGSPVNGVCGFANGSVLASAPVGSALCATGTPSPVSGGGPWTWTCAGSSGGSAAACSAALASMTYTLTVSTNAGTGGATSPIGASQRTSGESITVTATPNSGFAFANWTGYAGCGASASCTFSMPSSAVTLTANFTATPACTYSFNPTSISTLGSAAATGSFAVVTQSGCAIAEPVVSAIGGWLSASLSGSTVNFSATANTGTTSRSGTVTVSGQIMTITQNSSSNMCAVQPAPGKDTFFGTVYQTEGRPTWDTMWTGGWGDAYSSLVEIDLSALPSAASTQSAFLWLYVAGKGVNDPALQLSRITEPWTAAGVTSSNVPSTALVNTAPTWVLQGSWYKVDITSLYKDWKNGVYPNYGVMLSPTFTTNASLVFATSEATIASRRPKIVVQHSGGTCSTQPVQASCGIDVKGSGTAAAIPDGLLILRYLLGFRGAALTDSLSIVPPRNITAEIESFLADNDYSAVGTTASANVDGLILLRLLQGVPDAALLNGISLPVSAVYRSAADIRANVNARCGTTF
jgi:hypothetical protein